MSTTMWIIYRRVPRQAAGDIIARVTSLEAKDAALRLLFGSTTDIPDGVGIDELRQVGSVYRSVYR